MINELSDAELALGEEMEGGDRGMRFELHSQSSSGILRNFKLAFGFVVISRQLYNFM